VCMLFCLRVLTYHDFQDAAGKSMEVFHFQNLDYGLQIKFVCHRFIQILFEVLINYIWLEIRNLISINLLITLKIYVLFEALGILN